VLKQQWSKDEVALAILRLYADGEPLNYVHVEKHHTALLRAATRYHGSWRAAVEYAGLDYDRIRRYRSWDRERIVATIREYYERGEDLSWRHVSTRLDPALAAAAVRCRELGSWEAALAAAGLDYDQIRRYRSWDEATISRELERLARAGKSLKVSAVSEERPDLVAAARRYYSGWYEALASLGLMRAAPKREAAERIDLPLAADD